MIKSNLRRALLCVLLTLSFGASAEHIMPETSTVVVASNRDVNRIVCNAGDITNTYFSKEKGILVQNDGRNAYVKFKSLDDGSGVLKRVTQRSELYITCGGNVYTLILEPKDVDAITHYLGAGSVANAKVNLQEYGSMPDEERALDLTMAVLKNEIPESFSVTKPSMYTRDYVTNVIPNVELAKVQDVAMDGIGLTLQEYQVVAKQPVTLQETQFLDVYFGTNIFAVSIEPRTLAAGEYARVFVVQKGAN